MKRAVAAATLAAMLVAIGGATALGAPREPGLERMPLRSSTLSSVRELTLPAAPDRTAATWCGTASQTDRSPNALAGNPVHWVYAIPADGEDRLPDIASVMQTDAEEIDAWWRTQDGTRFPRNDLAQFPCGQQLDITTVRLVRSSAQLAILDERFARIVNGVTDADLRSPHTKYLVYYDGPVSDGNVCGQGGSDSSGFGVAVVYYRSCAGVSTAAVGAHEVLHTLDAVPRGAPNACPDDDGGHTCDDSGDLMFPSIAAVPLSAKVLDFGRDDYYGHSGAWPDIQDSAWLVRVDSQVPLALSLTGQGSVSADMPGLFCAQSCTTTWNGGTRLALTATPGPGARLVRWGSACQGAAGCSVTVTSGAEVSALFAPAAFPLTVRIAGRGVVRSARAGIACRPKCSATFPSYSPVRLDATPAKGWRFRSWSGACRGSKRACSVPMTAATTARAVFVRA